MLTDVMRGFTRINSINEWPTFMIESETFTGICQGMALGEWRIRVVLTQTGETLWADPHQYNSLMDAAFRLRQQLEDFVESSTKKQ